MDSTARVPPAGRLRHRIDPACSLAVRHLHLYVDVDDVLAETTRALNRLARMRFGKSVEFERMHSFDLSISLELTAAEYTRFMQAAHEVDFLLEIAPMQGAADVMREWQLAGAEISIVTGRPPASRAVTESWLAGEGMGFRRLEIVDKYGRHGEAPSLRLEALAARRYDVAIEDSAEMAGFLAEHTGAQVLLVDRPWNRAASEVSAGVRRVHSWREIRGAVAAAAAARPPHSRRVLRSQR